jgi:hypothetical protein
VVLQVGDSDSESDFPMSEAPLHGHRQWLLSVHIAFFRVHVVRLAPITHRLIMPVPGAYAPGRHSRNRDSPFRSPRTGGTGKRGLPGDSAAGELETCKGVLTQRLGRDSDFKWKGDDHWHGPPGPFPIRPGTETGLRGSGAPPGAGGLRPLAGAQSASLRLPVAATSVHGPSRRAARARACRPLIFSAQH